MGDLHFFIYLKNCCFFSLSHTHTHKFRFRLTDTFFHCLSPFSEFPFQSNPQIEDPFLILGSTRFQYRLCIWIATSLKSTTRQHIHKSFSKSLFSSSVIQELQKSVLARKISFTLSPLHKTFTYSHKNTISILKSYSSKTYLRQPSSSNNRLAPKTSAKIFCTAY